MTQEELGKRLREVRKEHGISRKRLAEDLHAAYGTRDAKADYSTLNMQERGDRVIRCEDALRLAEYYEISLDELVTGNKPENTDIHRDIGLTDSSIAVLRQLKTTDPDGRVMAALNRALSDSSFLNNLVTFMQIESSERGYYFASLSPEDGFYHPEMSPDTYAQTVLLTMNQQLERLRTGDRPKEYPPQTRRVVQETEELQQAGRLIEGSEDNAKARE